jgi:von Willebrand factor type A domain
MIDIVFSFDTTGSMYPCLSEVRRKISETTSELFLQVPDLRIGVVAHGDYIDGDQVYSSLNLTSDASEVQEFIKNAPRTYGGDAPEAYELVLHRAKEFFWRDDAKKVLVLIGDDVPHHQNQNPGKLDWTREASDLASLGINIHAVQCLNRSTSTSFYSRLATLGSGIHVPLKQFSEAVETITAITYQSMGEDHLAAYEARLVTSKKMTRTLDEVFSALSNRDPKTGRFRKVDTRAVDMGRFQIISVDHDTPIKELVESTGAAFKTGRGYYEFTKRETIQAYKEIILMEHDTGDMFEGTAARELLGLPLDGNIKISPDFSKNWTVFVQSTSNNRKLIGGTKFLYEVERDD